MHHSNIQELIWPINRNNLQNVIIFYWKKKKSLQHSIHLHKSDYISHCNFDHENFRPVAKCAFRPYGLLCAAARSILNQEEHNTQILNETRKVQEGFHTTGTPRSMNSKSSLCPRHHVHSAGSPSIWFLHHMSWQLAMTLVSETEKLGWEIHQTEPQPTGTYLLQSVERSERQNKTVAEQSALWFHPQ